MNTSSPDGLIWQALPSSLGVQVWITDLSATLPAHELDSVLSPSEKERAQRLKSQHLRTHYVNAHVGLRHLLGQYMGTSPYPHKFQTNRFGKPRLPEPSPIHFNLSHRHHRALVAMARDRPVGVDLEQVQPIPDMVEMVQNHFTPTERLQWAHLPQAGQTHAFYQVWTRKEACVKALGWGLNMPLDRVEVALPGPPKRLFLESPSGDWFQVWLESLPIEPGWVAALAHIESRRPSAHSLAGK